MIHIKELCVDVEVPSCLDNKLSARLVQPQQHPSINMDSTIIQSYCSGSGAHNRVGAGIGKALQLRSEFQQIRHPHVYTIHQALHSSCFKKLEMSGMMCSVADVLHCSSIRRRSTSLVQEKYCGSEHLAANRWDPITT